MTQQILNFSQKIRDKLYEKWGLRDELARDKVHMVGFQYDPISDGFTQSGKNTIIEVYRISGLLKSQTLGTKTLNELFKLDIWHRLSDKSEKARIEGEDARAKLLDTIFQIIHDNQTLITGLRFSFFNNWQNADELENNLIHESVFIVGEWFHQKT